MSTWIAHLRIADKVLRAHTEFDEEKFILGSIAPDSGIATEDGYIPSKFISHFWISETEEIPHPEIFYKKYLLNKEYNNDVYSFYMGYYVHLLTDMYWTNDVQNKKAEEYKNEFKTINDTWCAFKKDWYDLDFLYIKQHPCFKSWDIYKATTDLKNIYIKEYPVHAFEIKHKQILEFYAQKTDNLERQYKYLTKEEMDRFIDSAVERILKEI